MAPPGLRERKKERTRIALENAALELFEAHGYEDTTVEQIAELADVSTRTFFRYFPTKADVLLSDQETRLASVRAFLAARPADEPIMASIRAVMAEVSTELPAERRLLAAQHRWSHDSDELLAAVRNHHAAIVDILTEFIGTRLEAPDPVGGRAQAIATACIASLVTVATDWIEADEAEFPDFAAAIATIEASINVPS